MRKFVFVLAAAGATLVMPISLASAQTSRGIQSIDAATQNFTAIRPAASQGWGPYYLSGYVIQCGRRRCWCRPVDGQRSVEKYAQI
jgi:hypothetical protein